MRDKGGEKKRKPSAVYQQNFYFPRLLHKSEFVQPFIIISSWRFCTVVVRSPKQPLRSILTICDVKPSVGNRRPWRRREWHIVGGLNICLVLVRITPAQGNSCCLKNKGAGPMSLMLCTKKKKRSQMFSQHTKQKLLRGEKKRWRYGCCLTMWKGN